MLFFVIPFNIQLFLCDDSELGKNIVLVCMLICMIRNIELLYTEFIQMRQQSFSEYFSNGWNLFVDLFSIIVFFIYFLNRFHYLGSTLPYTENKEFLNHNPGDIDELYRQAYWVVMNSLIIISMANKCLYYMRVYKSFNHLVIMLIKVLADMVNYTCFFLMWVFVLSQLMKIVGFEVFKRSDKFPILDDYTANFLRMFRNSVGDIDSPAY